jgi:CRP-like cAMP-binding protein
VAALLGQTTLFGALKLAERQALCRRMLPIAFKAGELIFARGAPGDAVYLLLTGRVRLSVVAAKRALSFKHAGPGDIFGEVSCLDGGLRNADATALAPVEAMLLPREVLVELLDANPRMARAAVRWLCAQVRDSSAQTEGIALHPIEVRLARLLLSLLGFDRRRAASGEARLDVGVTQAELALLIGASRQKLNAALATLRRRGAIRRVGRQLSCNPAELARIAGAK